MQSDLTVRYHNMGNWLAESREPRATLLLVKMNEEIIFRETILEALKSALGVMDKRYWQYCVERIKATETNHTIKSETLVTLHNQLSEAQKHVAVLIAHARSLAIELIEKVKQLRQIHAKNVKTNAVVTIYWKDENYLLKMRNDMEFVNDSPTLRLWLGFTARELVLPPHSSANTMSATSAAITHIANLHDPKAHWARSSRRVYKEWFKKHEAYIQASWKSGKSKVIFKADRKFLTGDTRRSQVAPLSLLSPAITPGLTPDFTPDDSRPESPLADMRSGGNTERSSGPSSAAPTSRVSYPVSLAVTPLSPTQEILDRQLSSPFLTRESTPATGKLMTQLSSVSSPGEVHADSLCTSPVADTLAHDLATLVFEPILAQIGSDEPAIEHEQPKPVVPAEEQGVDRSSEQDEDHSSGIDNLRSDSDQQGETDSGAGVPRTESEDVGSLTNRTDESDGHFDHEDTSLLKRAVLGAARSASENAAHFDMYGIAMVKSGDSRDEGANQNDRPPTEPGRDASAVATEENKPTSKPGSRQGRPKSGPGSERLVREGNSATAVPAVEEVPEWVQLREYVKHSWGSMQVEEEFRDLHSDLERRGSKHALQDAKDGLAHYHKHSAGHDGTPTTGDRKYSLTDPTVGFRDSVAAAPSVKQQVTMHLQGRAAAPLFWKTVDHNPLVVEAATGFEECFPTFYLVPPMPSDLLVRAEKCARLLRREYEQELFISAQREACSDLKAHVLPNITSESMESLVTESHMYKSVEDGALLKLRQQGTTELLTGISVRHLSNSLSLDAGSLASLVAPSTSQMLAKQRSVAEGVQLEQSTDNVFLTDSLEQSESQVFLNKASEESLLLPNVQSFGSYVDTSGFNFFRIEECSKLRQRIEDKITDARKIVEYKEGELFPTLRPDRRNAREPDHDSAQWFYIHALRIQCLVRCFLARRRVRKTRVMAKFRRSAHKVRTLVIGFMWRYRQRQKYWEARFEAFVMRKMAVKKFRASMTLAAFFRKIVRARRQMRADDARAKLAGEGGLPGDKAGKQRMSVVAYTPISRNVRRKHGQLLTEDGETTELFPTPSQSHAPSPNRSRAATATNTAANTSRTSTSPIHTAAKATHTDRHVTISAEVTAYSVAATPMASNHAAAAATAESAASRVSSTNSLADSPLQKLTPIERQRRLEAPGPYEESKRREQLRNDALSLVARVNRGKIQSDTLHSCRLIPTQSVPNLSNTQAKMRKFATKEYAFLNAPNQPAPQSLIKSSSDVFVGPIPKRVNTPSTTLPHLQTSLSMETMPGSASGVSSSASSVLGSTSGARSFDGTHGGFRGIHLPAGSGSFSAFATPAGSSKLATAGSNVLHSGTSSVSSTALGRVGTPNRRHSTSSTGSASSPPESTPGKTAQLGSATLHFGAVHSTPGSAGHGGVAPLLRYNSTGLTVRSKKQMVAHEKAEAERVQLRSTLMKYM
jgi:hypothetical protein